MISTVIIMWQQADKMLDTSGRQSIQIHRSFVLDCICLRGICPENICVSESSIYNIKHKDCVYEAWENLSRTPLNTFSHQLQYVFTTSEITVCNAIECPLLLSHFLLRLILCIFCIKLNACNDKNFKKTPNWATNKHQCFFGFLKRIPENFICCSVWLSHKGDLVSFSQHFSNAHSNTGSARRNLTSGKLRLMMV